MLNPLTGQQAAAPGRGFADDITAIGQLFDAQRDNEELERLEAEALKPLPELQKHGTGSFEDDRRSIRDDFEKMIAQIRLSEGSEQDKS